MIKVKFDHVVFGEKVKVVASAKDVDVYGAIGLKLRFVDKSGEPVEIPIDRNTFEELSEIAAEHLYDRKYTKELEF